MKLLINKDNDGSTEIQNLTGSYYANNEFDRIKTDWLLAQEEIQALVGKNVMQRALDHYLSDNFSAEYDGSGSASLEIENDLVLHLQIPIAYKATFRYYQSNLVGHEDAGRKVKIDNENEKLPWEWMLDRDDAAQVRKANETTDRVIKFLEENQVNEWIESNQRKLTRSLLVNTAELFQQAYPIDHSPRFFYVTSSFNLEVQTRIIKKALGSKYDVLIAYWQNFNSVEGSGSAGGGLPGEPETDEALEDLLALVQQVIPQYIMIRAVKRLQLQALPDGVVQTFKSMITSRNASQATMPEVVSDWCKRMQEDADYELDDIKRLLLASDPDALDYPLLPKNDETNKYLRT